MNDEINSPGHYTTGNLETIVLLQESLGHEQFVGYLRGNVFKYISRYRHKHAENPVKDLRKAEWYLRRLITLTEGEQL